MAITRRFFFKCYYDYYVNVVLISVDACERWTNSGFACISKEKYVLIYLSLTSAYLRVRAAFSHSRSANRPFWPLVSKYTINRAFDEKKNFDSQEGSQVRSQNRKNDHFGNVGIFFFFSRKKKLFVVIFGVKFTENYYDVAIFIIISRLQSKVEKT